MTVLTIFISLLVLHWFYAEGEFIETSVLVIYLRSSNCVYSYLFFLFILGKSLNSTELKCRFEKRSSSDAVFKTSLEEQ